MVSRGRGQWGSKGPLFLCRGSLRSHFSKWQNSKMKNFLTHIGIHVCEGQTIMIGHGNFPTYLLPQQSLLHPDWYTDHLRPWIFFLNMMIRLVISWYPHEQSVWILAWLSTNSFTKKLRSFPDKSGSWILDDKTDTWILSYLNNDLP